MCSFFVRKFAVNVVFFICRQVLSLKFTKKAELLYFENKNRGSSFVVLELKFKKASLESKVK